MFHPITDHLVVVSQKVAAKRAAAKRPFRKCRECLLHVRVCQSRWSWLIASNSEIFLLGYPQRSQTMNRQPAPDRRASESERSWMEGFHHPYNKITGFLIRRGITEES
jgi:hypothetical protein